MKKLTRHGSWPYSFDTQWCKSEDVARLEASHAELLAGLQQCVALLDNGGTWTLEHQAQVRSAIAKAEGEQP